MLFSRRNIKSLNKAWALSQRGRWALLGTVGHCWALLGTVGHCWALLGTVGHRWALLGTVGHIVTYKALWNSSSQEIHSRLHELDADQLTSIVRPGRPVWCEIQGIWICHDLTRFDHKVRKSCAVQRPCLNSDLELIAYGKELGPPPAWGSGGWQKGLFFPKTR